MDDCRRITAPTLVVTGEAELDQIVPVESTRDYLSAIRGARGAVFTGTGHLGLVTRPEAFAKLVGEFVDSTTSESREPKAESRS